MALRDDKGASSKRSIIFFDGPCPLCHWFVNILIQIDRDKQLYFAPLQGSTATHYDQLLAKSDTVVFFHNTHRYEKSKAIIEVLIYIKPFWIFLYLLKLIPDFILNGIYDFIAKRRTKLMKTCAPITNEDHLLP